VSVCNNKYSIHYSLFWQDCGTVVTAVSTCNTDHIRNNNADLHISGRTDGFGDGISDTNDHNACRQPPVPVYYHPSVWRMECYPGKGSRNKTGDIVSQSGLSGHSSPDIAYVRDTWPFLCRLTYCRRRDDCAAVHGCQK